MERLTVPKLFGAAKKRLTLFCRLLNRSLKHPSRDSNLLFVSAMPDNGLMRIPRNQIGNFSSGVARNAHYAAGKAICFETNSPIIAIEARYEYREYMENMTTMGSSSIDVFRMEQHGPVHLACIAPSNEVSMHAKGTFETAGVMRQYALLLPSFAELKSLMIGLSPESSFSISEMPELPRVLFYGSSITQGCASSRPGLNYVNIIALEMPCVAINYGFSASAKGEPEIAELISQEHADIYVIEYDHNATVEELKKTHLPLYRRVRSSNPESPLIFLSRLSGGVSISLEEAEQRQAIIEETLRTARTEGDKGVYYISGGFVPFEQRAAFLQDDRHPNDAGMRLLADKIKAIIQEYHLDQTP